MNCSLCDCELTDATAIFLNCYNTPIHEPRCRDCYERAIRRVSPGDSHDIHLSPTTVDAMYHGDNYWG